MNAPPGDPESDSLKWLTFCDRVNNHGEDPYVTMREMGLDQHFFENVPMAEPVSSSEDVVGLPFVETVDERGESPVAEEIFTAPPTITDSPVQGMNIPDELRDEITDIEPESEQFSDRVRRIETSPTAQLFNQRIVNTPDTAPGNQEYDETTFHNLTGLWFPGSANESRTRDARRMDMEIEFNTPLIDNPYAGENDIYLTGRSLTQYEDWRDNEVQQGSIDMDTETIFVNDFPGGRRTLIPFSGFGPFNPIRGQGYVEMPDSFWRWLGITRHRDEDYFFNRFRRRNRTTGGSRKKNKKKSKKRRKTVKSKKSKKNKRKYGGNPPPSGQKVSEPKGILRPNRKINPTSTMRRIIRDIAPNTTTKVKIDEEKNTVDGNPGNRKTV